MTAPARKTDVELRMDRPAVQGRENALAGAMQVYIRTNVFKPEVPQYHPVMTIPCPTSFDIPPQSVSCSAEADVKSAQPESRLPARNGH